MRRYALLIMLAMLFVLVACQEDNSPPEQAVASTAVDDLPMNTSNTDAQTNQTLPTPIPDDLIQEADAEYLLLTNLYERSIQSVVNVEVIIRQSGSVGTGNGSGFIIDTQGHIVTNAHVVNGATEIYVTFHDGRVVDAEIIGLDVFSDIAVIRVDAPESHLLPLVLTDSDAVRVGQRAIAIGNPFGLNGSMTVGVVSAVGRQLASAQSIDTSVIEGFNNPNIIQVDTDINPGNSGGPLLNSYGQVIGINTAIRSSSGTFEGIGFAVPSNTIGRVVPELIANGEIDYAWIGISTDSGFDVAGLAQDLELPVDEGVLLRQVVEGGPADNAGLRGGDAIDIVRGTGVCVGGDIIIAVNGNFVRNMDELVTYLVVNTRPNDIITVLAVRGNETFETEVTLRSRPTSGGNPSSCER